jgi:hypothetical protein
VIIQAVGIDAQVVTVTIDAAVDAPPDPAGVVREACRARDAAAAKRALAKVPRADQAAVVRDCLAVGTDLRPPVRRADPCAVDPMACQ